jgi:hypothetical protein
MPDECPSSTEGSMLGVSTIGNAILIAYDDNPILATDPWVWRRKPGLFWVIIYLTQ